MCSCKVSFHLCQLKLTGIYLSCRQLSVAFFSATWSVESQQMKDVIEELAKEFIHSKFIQVGYFCCYWVPKKGNRFEGSIFNFNES